MDNIEEITKRVEDTQKEIAIKESNRKIATIEQNSQYSSMSMPMTQFMSNAKIEDDTVDDEVTQKIQREVNNALKDDKFVNKKSRKLAKVGDKLVEEEIKLRDNTARAKKAKNRVDRQIIKNNLYVAKQEKKRAVKEQKHLNRCQKETHKQEVAEYRWKEYGDMLQKYNYEKTPSDIVFKVIVFFDGSARLWDSLNRANNKFIKAMKFVIIAGILVLVYYLIKKYL